MPILREFDYHRPATVKEAVKLLAKYKKPAVLAGGTDLVNGLKDEVSQPDAVIDIKGLRELRAISFKKNLLTIGAAVTFAELIESKLVQAKYPVIAEVARAVGSAGVRNRATMAGNICSAVPCADSAPLLAAYGARVCVQGPKGKRKVPAAKWFKGNRKTDIKKGELVTAIEFALPAKAHGGCFVKLGRYSGEDLAQASVLVLALPEHRYRVAFGSVAPAPVRAEKIEDLLNGKGVSGGIVRQAQELIPSIISPITDIRASREYRLQMCRVMFERGLRAAVARLDGGGPSYGTSLI
ncbi:MAG TPA: xanthine dehydrogenase family protein subunit M [Candidatus Edwardsbacteria bacterium]|nr:xanthine dehydrogenase family protein subunit M [Candidatus Edwardsbacteria bacterium]